MKIQLATLTIVLSGASCGTAQDPPSQTESQADTKTEGKLLAYNGRKVNGVPAPWVLDDRAGEPNFTFLPDETRDDEIIAMLRSDRASFSFDYPTNIDSSKFSRIQWSWKATILPTGGDVRENSFFSSRNDQALQVLLIFENENTISYVWDTTAPVKTMTKESYPGVKGVVRVLVIESGEKYLNKWRAVSRDYANDYKMLFKKDIESPLVRIRIQTNSQHTKSVGEGYLTPILLLPPEESGTETTTSPDPGHPENR